MRIKMVRKKRSRRKPYSWQFSRLKDFIQQEQADCLLYEMCYEKLGKTFSFQVLSAMVFILNDVYARKPGSLVTLYREAHSADGPCVDFEKRYEKYYYALREQGYL